MHFHIYKVAVDVESKRLGYIKRVTVMQDKDTFKMFTTGTQSNNLK